MEALISFLLLIVVIAIMYLNAMHKDDEYIIKKGRHSCSGIRFGFSKKLTEFVCTFTDSCLYNENELPSSGWNKLWGISSPFIHKNSARIGWRCENGDIRVSSYCYVNGERLIKDMGIVPVNEDIYMEVEMTDDGYEIRIGNKEHTVYTKKKSKLLFRCFPYFGGKSTAPHDMKIFLKKL